MSAKVTCACAIPNLIRIVNTGAVVIHRKYRFSTVNKSIAMSIIKWEVHRWLTAKLSFSQERRTILSVASDGLTNIYKDGLTKYDIKQHKYVRYLRKIAFTLKNEIEAEGLSCPKAIRILTIPGCISVPNLVILAWTSDKLLHEQAQNGINFWF